MNELVVGTPSDETFASHRPHVREQGFVTALPVKVSFFAGARQCSLREFPDLYNTYHGRIS